MDLRWPRVYRRSNVGLVVIDIVCANVRMILQLQKLSEATDILNNLSSWQISSHEEIDTPGGVQGLKTVTLVTH